MEIARLDLAARPHLDEDVIPARTLGAFERVPDLVQACQGIIGAVDEQRFAVLAKLEFLGTRAGVGVCRPSVSLPG